MSIIIEYLDNLPQPVKSAAVGALIKVLTQRLKKIKKLGLSKAKKWVKLIVVVGLGAVASAIGELRGGEFVVEHFLSTWGVYVTTAVFTHEAWDKIVVSWFSNRKPS